VLILIPVWTDPPLCGRFTTRGLASRSQGCNFEILCPHAGCVQMGGWWRLQVRVDSASLG
jgi:hypothetical protein